MPLLDHLIVLVPALDKIVDSAHVLLDEVTKITRSFDELLIVDPQRRALKDFTYLTHLAYKDDENGVLYVTTRVTTQSGFTEGGLGKVEPLPIHAKDVETMLLKHWENKGPHDVV